jgi:membrane-associated phospholipid phosphatase
MKAAKFYLAVAVPALVWSVLARFRAIFIFPRCHEFPQLCHPSLISWPDAGVFRLQSSLANQLSYVTQNLSGALAAVLLLVFYLRALKRNEMNPESALRNALTDLWTLLQAMFWNGVFLEATRILVQRPRPFVYSSPEGLGENAAHYTSFYSGHTSFAAAMFAASLCILMQRKASRHYLVGSWAIASSFVFLTALFRVLAGRHFVTDVVAGLCAGITVGVAVAYYQPGSRALRASAGRA